jgi:hypothetical protein
MDSRHVWIPPLVAIAITATLQAQQGTLVTETEPNDAFATANVVRLGDTISGFIDRHSDRDYFAVDIPAGKIQVVIAPQFCPGLMVFADDKQTIVGSLNCYSSPRTINLLVTTAGRYYLRLLHDDDRPDEVNDPPLAYRLRVARYEPPPTGPGNPMRLVTQNVNEIAAMVAAPNGDMIVADQFVDQAGQERIRLRRMNASGQFTTIADDVTPSGQIAVDAFGDLLVPSYDQGGVVWRYNLTTGARTIFTGPNSGRFSYTGVAIGADGDVWISEPGYPGASVSRFDALGVFKEKVALPVRTFALTTSQSGELFFMAQDSGDVYKLVNNAMPQRVITAPSPMKAYGNRSEGMGTVALDQDGWVYLTQPKQGKLLLFNAQYQAARDPLAQVLDSLGWIEQHTSAAGSVWMRDANGNMTSRLLVGRGPGLRGNSEILEINHASMGAPGADPGLHLDLTALRAGAQSSTYADTLRLAGSGSATWSIVSGHLPSGVALTAATGVLAGMPAEKGTFDFAVKAVNGSRAGFGRFSITVGEATTVQVAVNDIANALMGGPALPAATVQYLDSHGNHNGMLDVGDLRAYQRAQGQIPGVTKP